MKDLIDIKTITVMYAKARLFSCQPPKHENLEILKKSPEKPGDWEVVGKWGFWDITTHFGPVLKKI